MKINFVDLKAQYASIQKEIEEAIRKVMDRCAFASGPFVEAFEKRFASAHKAEHCVGVNSGTSALHLALWSLDIGQGDEVIVPTNTFIATAEAVSLCGATPVFVDCESRYFNLDPEKIEDAVTEKTRAVIAVHLYGQPAQLDEIAAVCERFDLLLIEDCAQAHLAEYKGRPVGTFGAAGCFSFYPGKNLGAYGEAGAVMTGDETLYHKMRALRDHGSSQKYYHDAIGHNYRMDGIQGAVLDVKLGHLRRWTELRRRNAELYRTHLSIIDAVGLPEQMEAATHVYHLFVVTVPERDRLITHLNDNGIFVGIHYPIPCHLQKAYGFLPQRPGAFAVSEKKAEEILSLPMYAELTESEINYVCEKMASFYGS
jgi:dTDP-4-amino-4,6-dideoxygalactose transaminase